MELSLFLMIHNKWMMLFQCSKLIYCSKYITSTAIYSSSYFVKDDREGGEIEQDTHKICWIIEKW